MRFGKRLQSQSECGKQLLTRGTQTLPVLQSTWWMKDRSLREFRDINELSKRLRSEATAATRGMVRLATAAM